MSQAARLKSVGEALEEMAIAEGPPPAPPPAVPLSATLEALDKQASEIVGLARDAGELGVAIRAIGLRRELAVELHDIRAGEAEAARRRSVWEVANGRRR